MIIVVQCKDQVGLVAAISGVVAGEKINIISLREYVDQTENLFFMRLEIEPIKDTKKLEEKMKSVLPNDAICQINPEPEKKIIVLVTKEYHCLSDLLVRNHFGVLGASIQCVIGNHETLNDICDRFEIPFFYVPFEKSGIEVFEEKIASVINEHHVDYIVLAKFMRILSPKFVAKYPCKIINIHHSFLPAFIGANPYKQAHERGVKLIGATAHFVTNDLDEGPIVSQQIIPVTHFHTAEDMMKAGKEVEKSVLANALRLIFEDRVFVYSNKTVVFE